ncbi:hypothetical protein CXG81DRAFT_25707 [Caulochytrium protostelioides]|uniref:TRP C-terminal domain-containing protein n=1 Tax=Caulochytrium protostelioides TaxID=1555241 RepID=A0A4P9X9D1_9FUNG|nr:hypothetical protein CXG81DRAFT_25707 [Caulochytrium protostelioides]|eukprot:RKP01611.1 hypothetical protein CXG81DRAFT_25707 [Caulochytrium protostelioides]
MAFLASKVLFLGLLALVLGMSQLHLRTAEPLGASVRAVVGPRAHRILGSPDAAFLPDLRFMPSQAVQQELAKAWGAQGRHLYLTSIQAIEFINAMLVTVALAAGLALALPQWPSTPLLTVPLLIAKLAECLGFAVVTHRFPRTAPRFAMLGTYMNGLKYSLLAVILVLMTSGLVHRAAARRRQPPPPRSAVASVAVDAPAPTASSSNASAAASASAKPSLTHRRPAPAASTS